MKKALVILLAVVLTLALFAGCGAKEVTGDAYAPVHGGGYIGKATVTVDNKGAVLSATLDEACYPTHIEPTDAVTAADKTTGEIISRGKPKTVTYFNVVKFGGVTATLDATKMVYMVDGKEWLTWVQAEANAKKYFDAVVANDVAVVVGGKDDKTIMTAQALLKSLNGYGKPNFDWTRNMQATVDYVVKNGFAASSSLKQGDDKVWVDSNNVAATGATWSDMNTKKDNTVSYIALLEMAFNKVAKAK